MENMRTKAAFSAVSTDVLHMVVHARLKSVDVCGDRRLGLDQPPHDTSTLGD